ncbi:MAG: hypothetical protein V3W22_07300 [Thermoplasmata archaeon]
MRIPIFDWLWDAWEESKRETERAMWADYNRGIRERREELERQKAEVEE